MNAYLSTKTNNIIRNINLQKCFFGILKRCIVKYASMCLYFFVYILHTKVYCYKQQIRMLLCKLGNAMNAYVVCPWMLMRNACASWWYDGWERPPVYTNVLYVTCTSCCWNLPVTLHRLLKSVHCHCKMFMYTLHQCYVCKVSEKVSRTLYI